MKPAPLNVVITGASSGIGEALAREYARRGATLCLFARRQEDLLDRFAATLVVRAHASFVDVPDADARALRPTSCVVSAVQMSRSPMPGSAPAL